jgi:hypothetical protein
MSNKWQVTAFILCLATTLLNAAVFLGQASIPATARSASTTKLLDDDDFLAGLTKIIRKTVRDYCTVGKKESIDC